MANGCKRYVYDETGSRWYCCFPASHAGAHFGQRQKNWAKRMSVLGWYEAYCGDAIILEETTHPYSSAYKGMMQDAAAELCQCEC